MIGFISCWKIFRSLRSLVKYFSCHSKRNFVSPRGVVNIPYYFLIYCYQEPITSDGLAPHYHLSATQHTGIFPFFFFDFYNNISLLRRGSMEALLDFLCPKWVGRVESKTWKIHFLSPCSYEPMRRRELYRGTQRQFSENICSEDDLRSRIFGTFVVKFLACLPLLGFSNSPKNGIIAHF